MLSWFKEVDRILRGEATGAAALRAGALRIPAFRVGAAAIIMGLSYGFFMGWYALINRDPAVYQQLLATTVKVPALFLLTLVVTLPSLYVFNALVGSRLTAGAVFRLLTAGLAVTLAVLASLGPIIAFFSVTTENYSFMVLLNVVLFAVAGVLGLAFLLRTLHRLSTNYRSPVPVVGDAGTLAPTADVQTDDDAVEESAESPGALEPIDEHVLGPHVRTVFRIWVVIFALVGSQMSWVLRPFIGNPNLPFEWFRQRESNFFEAIWGVLQSLVS